MFKLSMCCALFSMMFLLRGSRLRFNRYVLILGCTLHKYIYICLFLNLFWSNLIFFILFVSFNSVIFCFSSLYFILFCFTLLYFILFCFALFYFILLYFILLYFILFYFILFKGLVYAFVWTDVGSFVYRIFIKSISKTKKFRRNSLFNM